MKKPDLFDYLDYRKFLKDSFEAMKSKDPKFSFRIFAKEAGYTSPNLLQLIIAGNRDLGLKDLPGTTRALKLNKQQSEFFTSLVGFEQAKGFEEKNFHYQKMIRSKHYAAAKPIEKGQFEYFDQWYHPVVRELLTHKEFTGELSWITERIYPRLTLPQVEKSVALLQRLGFVRPEEGMGRWVQAETRISTPSEVTSLAVVNYHRAVLKLASDAIEGFPPEERDLRSVTLGIPKSAFGEVKRKMEAFWREIIALGEAQQGVEDVVQINLQLFPLTKGKAKDNA